MYYRSRPPREYRSFWEQFALFRVVLYISSVYVVVHPPIEYVVFGNNLPFFVWYYISVLYI